MDKIWQGIKSNEGIVIFLLSMACGLIVGWTNFNNSLQAVQAQANTNSNAISANAITVSSMEAQIATLNANVFIVCSSLHLNCIQPK